MEYDTSVFLHSLPKYEVGEPTFSNSRITAVIMKGLIIYRTSTRHRLNYFVEKDSASDWRLDCKFHIRKVEQKEMNFSVCAANRPRQEVATPFHLPALSLGGGEALATISILPNLRIEC